MSKPKKHLNFPKKIFLYPSDYDDGEPVWAATTDLGDVDEGEAALYELRQVGKCHIDRTFKYE